jgi:hypothetical protein
MQRFREYPILIMLAAGVILFLRIIQGIAQSSPDPILISFCRETPNILQSKQIKDSC